MLVPPYADLGFLEDPCAARFADLEQARATRMQLAVRADRNQERLDRIPEKRF